MSRVLDGNPGQYKPVTIPNEADMGVGGVIKLYYRHLIQDSIGVIEVEGCRREVPPEVVAMLKSILYAGVCRIEDRAAACRKVFLAALNTNDTAQFIQSFDPTDTDPYVIAIYAAIKEVWRV